MRPGLSQMFALIQQLYTTNYTDQSDFDGQDSGHTFGGDVRLSLSFHDPDAGVAQLFAGRRRRSPPAIDCTPDPTLIHPSLRASESSSCRKVRVGRSL